MSDSLSIIIILICLVLSGYFSATETALSTFNKTKIKTLAEKGNKKAQKVLDTSEKYDRMLSTILIGNNVVNILSASLATLLFVKWINETTGPSVSTLVMTVIVLIFGEITPKTLAKERPEAFSMFSVSFLNFLMIILAPFSYIFKKLLY